MKRTVLVFGIFFAILLSCDNNHWADSVITNNSLFPVTFKFNHTGEITLTAGESATFETKAYQHLEYCKEKRVDFTYEATNSGYTGIFKTKPAYAIKVNNSIGENVTLSADGWMDEMDNITPGNTDDANHRGIIYTKTPVFSVKRPGNISSEAIAIAEYNYIENERTFYVTIKRFP